MLAIGTVKENWQEGEPGFVKVEYAMGEPGKSISDWLPVMTAYGGDGYGALCLPEIGSQVVIGFLHDDQDQPLVLGSLWGRQNRVPDGAVGKDNEKKSLRTKAGYLIEVDEKEEKVSFYDPKRENTFLLDGKAGKLAVGIKAELEISIGGEVAATITKDRIALGGKLAITDDVEIKAKNVFLEGEENLEVRGNGVSLKGTTLKLHGKQLELSGDQWKAAAASMELKAQAMGKLEAGGLLELKGGMVKLN